MWLKQAVAASKGLADGDAGDQAFYQGKLAATRFFFRYELPKSSAGLSLVASLDSTCYDLTAEQFLGA
jgi:butyryl-CoA dehydrogenase